MSPATDDLTGLTLGEVAHPRHRHTLAFEDRGFAAIVGPPAVGKSTVTGKLTGRCGARVFRLREFAHDYRSRPGIDETLFATCDPLGWFGDTAVAALLEAAFLHGQFPVQGVVFLENFPGSLTQVRMVQSIARDLGIPLVVIELTAPDSVLAARARARRVCPTCERQPRGDPHRPALHARPDQCARCGGRLVSRRSDIAPLFAARLQRFRSRILAIRREVATLRLPYEAVDATGDGDTCLQRTTAALATMQAHLFTPRHERI